MSLFISLKGSSYHRLVSDLVGVRAGEGRGGEGREVDLFLDPSANDFPSPPEAHESRL